MRYSFKDIVIDSRTGLNPRSNFVLGNGNNNYITIKDIYNGQINISDKTDKVDDAAIQIIKRRSRIKVGDILFVSIGRIGETAIVTSKDDSWDINESVFVFTVNEEIVTPEYFCLLFQSENVKKYLVSYSSGSTFKSIKMNQLEKMSFDLPSLSVQKTITSQLAKTKVICALRERELEMLDNLVKARFVEMFGDAIHNDKNWDTDSVDGLCEEIYGGGTPSKSHDEYYDNGIIPWVSSKDMKSDVITDSQIHITQLGIDNSTTRLVPVNSVIMVIRSGILKHTLPVAINSVPVTVNQDLKVFIPGRRILTRFLAMQFKMHEGDILSGVRAVTADNIEFNSLKQRQMIVPPLELQREYIRFLEQIDKSRDAIQIALYESRLLFSSLLGKYFK